MTFMPIRFCAIVLLIPFLLAAASMPSEQRSVRPIQFKDTEWRRYENPAQLFSLSLPSRLKINFTSSNSLDWSADNRMPFDYVNFRPQPPDASAAPFELGIGVHWNRDRLDTREFADKKDEGLVSGGARIEMIRQSEVSIGGLRGVRDDFRMRQPHGWQSYSRVIVPYGDKFIVFLGTLGADRPVAEYEGVYRKILESFTVEGAP